MAGVTMSCNVDIETYQEVEKKIKEMDISISRYLRILIERDVKDGKEL